MESWICLKAWIWSIISPTCTTNLPNILAMSSTSRENMGRTYVTNPPFYNACMIISQRFVMWNTPTCWCHVTRDSTNPNFRSHRCWNGHPQGEKRSNYRPWQYSCLHHEDASVSGPKVNGNIQTDGQSLSTVNSASNTSIHLLGNLLGNWDLDSCQRCMAVVLARKLNNVRPILNNFKAKVYTSIICPVPCWPATTKQDRALHTMEIQMLCWLLGLT